MTENGLFSGAKMELERGGLVVVRMVMFRMG